MLLKLKITPGIAAKAIKKIYAEDDGYYAWHLQNVNKLSGEFWSEFGGVVDLFCLRYGANKIGDSVCWVTSGGNALVINRTTATYYGVRHAARQLGWMFIDDFQQLEVIKYESSMPWLQPWETLEEFCKRACKTSDNKHEKAIALLREGKSDKFLLAEGDLPLRDAKAMHRIALAKGYYD